jgi:hypothetical protein
MFHSLHASIFTANTIPRAAPEPSVAWLACIYMPTARHSAVISASSTFAEQAAAVNTSPSCNADYSSPCSRSMLQSLIRLQAAQQVHFLLNCASCPLAISHTRHHTAGLICGADDLQRAGQKQLLCTAVLVSALQGWQLVARGARRREEPRRRHPRQGPLRKPPMLPSFPTPASKRRQFPAKDHRGRFERPLRPAKRRSTAQMHLHSGGRSRAKHCRRHHRHRAPCPRRRPCRSRRPRLQGRQGVKLSRLQLNPGSRATWSEAKWSTASRPRNLCQHPASQWARSKILRFLSVRP